MANTSHPLRAVVDTCATLRFAPLPGIRGGEVLHANTEHTDIVQWHRCDLLLLDGGLGCLYDKMMTQHALGHQLPAPQRFLRALLREPLFLLSASVYLTERAPGLDPTHLWFPWRSSASFGTPLLTDTTVALLPGDPGAGHPDAVVLPDRAALDRWAATRLVATVEPIITAVHQHTRMGIRQLWGWVVDTLYFYMLNPARFLGHDAGRAWERATLLADEVLRAGAVFRRRPRLFPFCASHPQGTWAVRSTCCFEYKSDAEHGYCLTCPLRDDDSRREKLMDWLRIPTTAP